MRFLRLAPFSLALALAACGQLPIDPARTPHALVSSTHLVQPDRVEVYKVAAVDGWAGSGGAADDRLQLKQDTRVPVAAGRPVRLDIEGRVAYDNPAINMFKGGTRVAGRVEFTPADGALYAVRGEIGLEGAKLWLENSATHEQIGQKFHADAPAPAEVRRFEPNS